MVDAGGPSFSCGFGLAADEKSGPPGLRRMELERWIPVLAGVDRVPAPRRWESVLKGFCIILGVNGLILSAPVPGRAASPEFSHALYDQVLKERVVDGRVDYAHLKANRGGLDRYVASLGELKPHVYEAWNEPTKIAFWINAYNAITLRVILDHYPIRVGLSPADLAFPANSIRQIPGVWDRITHPVLGKPMTLDAIEHKILRAQFREPRIHMALVCAARSCPPLRSEAYEGKRLSEQLDGQTRRFLANTAQFQIDRQQQGVWLSSIFQWFGEDFLGVFGAPKGFNGHAESERAVLAFISRYLASAEAEFLRNGEYRVAYLPYDWSLNDTAPTQETTGRRAWRVVRTVGAWGMGIAVVAVGIRRWRQRVQKTQPVP